MFTSTPKIRTKTIIMPVKRTPAQAQAPSSAPPANRYTLTPSTKARAVAQRPSLSVSRVSKRKVTPSTPQWASSDSEESEDEDRLGSGLRKRQKTSSSIEPTAINRCLEPDLRRRIRSRRPIKKDENKAKADSQIPELIHGSEMTRGEWVKLFKPAFKDHASVMVELQYPSPARPERFEIVIPRKDNDFNPLNDIYFSIEETIQHYLPPDLASELSDETNGTVRLLKRAVVKDSPSDFKSVLTDFNTLLKSKLKDGTITGILDNLHAIPLSLTNQILAQVYQRTVSPYAHLLRRVKGKETTYGELLPPFIHAIFHQTRLNSTHVFVDLGSGVGNVVLQSALQTGAESWGIEIMDTPAKYAERQARELRARSRLWNVSLGPIHLRQGDFLESEDIDSVLRRADVVLVNNKVFPQSLNNALLNKFLDLKQGCKVVSLETFGGGKQGVRNEQSIANLFDEERHESGTDSVSWAGESVEYFIATKVR